MAKRVAAVALILFGLLGLVGLSWLALGGAASVAPIDAGDETQSTSVEPARPDTGHAPPGDPARRRRVRVVDAAEPTPTPTPVAPKRGKGGVPAPAPVAIVVDEAGRPIPGATVELQDGERRWRCAAAADGSFARDGAGPFPGKRVVRVTAPGFAPAEHSLSSDENWILILAGTHRMEGHVLGADGRGVEEASVVVVPAKPGAHYKQRTWPVTTGSAGAFGVEKLPPGIFVVTADASATRTRPAGHVSVTVPADTLDVELRLERALRVEGRVVDESGKPFAGKVHVVMRAVQPNGDAGKVWSAPLAAEDGTFVIKGVNTPKNMLWAWLGETEAGYAMTVLRDLTPGEPSIDIVLKAGRVIKARITDDQGKVPAGPAHWYVITRGVGVVNSSTTNNGEITTHPLQYDARYDLVVYHAAGWTGEVRDVRPGTHDVVIAMHRAGDITGTVVLPNGEPAGAGIIIHARALSDDNRMRTGVESKVETDADGRFRITGIADLPFVVSSWPSTHGYAPARAPGEHLPGSDVRIRLASGASISGRLLGANNVPAGKRTLWLLPTDDTPWSRKLITADDGTFTAGALPSSSIFVTLERPEGSVVLAIIVAPAKDLRLDLPTE